MEQGNDISLDLFAIVAKEQLTISIFFILTVPPIFIVPGLCYMERVKVPHMNLGDQLWGNICTCKGR